MRLFSFGFDVEALFTVVVILQHFSCDVRWEVCVCSEFFYVVHNVKCWLTGERNKAIEELFYNNSCFAFFVFRLFLVAALFTVVVILQQFVNMWCVKCVCAPNFFSFFIMLKNYIVIIFIITLSFHYHQIFCSSQIIITSC